MNQHQSQPRFTKTLLHCEH